MHHFSRNYMRKIDMMLELLIISFLWFSSFSAVSTVATNLNSTNEVLTVCPGELISVMCTHTNTAGGITRWEFRGVTGVSDCIKTLLHSNPQNFMCGVFTITMISDLSVSPPFSSTAQATATEALDGAVVQCFDSGLDSEVESVSIRVRNSDMLIPTITSVEQISQSVVRVSMSVADSQCVGSYLVEATPVGVSGSTNTSSPTPTVDVSGLDVCQYNYSLVGSILTTDGVQSVLSSQVSFSANLSVLNGIIVTINQEDPLIEWVQGDNPLYPTCTTGYFIEDQLTGLSTTVDSTTRSLTAQQLNDAGLPYCANIHPTVTPITPMGPLERESANTDILLTDSNFPIPILTSSFFLLNDTVILRITLQTISSTVVPSRSYQYTISRSNPTATFSETSNRIRFTDDYFEIELPTDSVAGISMHVTVIFQKELCQSQIITEPVVPPRSIEGTTVKMSTNTSQTVTITLPLTEYQPEQLLIISTASAPGEDDVTVMADFTLPSAQYTVTFTDLNALTEYTFTIRIVLRSDSTVDVVPAVSGTINTAAEPSPTISCGVGCIAGIAIATITVLVLLLILVTLVMMGIKRLKDRHSYFPQRVEKVDDSQS